ncbi:protein dispatched homolog 3-like [Mytilus edulis]|uniref:protein dispatched homolog 3-like n=1 Tax=Mytilus edulis TaxID=6550 RepID=UPI0039F02C11
MPSNHRYSSVPLDDQFDEEFIDQERQLHQNDEQENHETQNESDSTVRYCCKIPNLKTCRCNYCSKCSKTSKIIIAIVILVVFNGFCIGLGCLSVFVLKPGPVLDKSYHAFSIPNHVASMNYDSFKLAAKNSVMGSSFYSSMERAILNLKRPKRDATSNLKRQKRDIYNYNLQWKIQWKMQVVFLAEGDEDKNIFTKERLEFIHGIEQRIMNHTKFKEFCFKNHLITDPALKGIHDCAPLNSLMQYFYPTIDGSNNTHFDGLGSELADIESTIRFAMSTSDHFYYFVDQNINKTHRKSRLLRTEVLFGSPIKGYNSPYERKDEQSDKFKDFVLSYVEMLSKASNEKVTILYGGNEIFDYEVNSVFWNDVKLASFSLAAIFIFMLILTSFSVWLTFFGLCSILLCFPLAVFFYHTVFSVAAFGILNGVAAFVIIGIGVDDVFVFINIYRQATNMKTPEARIKHTLITAGKATFFTSFTTAAAFAANTASSIPAVHQFGLFMSLIVSCCWVTVLVVMPPALYIWGVGIQRWEEHILSKICTKCKFKVRSLPNDIVDFVGGKTSEGELQVGRNLPTTDEEEEDDVQLLSLDDPMEYYIERYGADEDDEVLLIPDNTLHRQGAPPNSANQVKESSLIQLLQIALYHYVALPVIRFRRVFIGFSVLIMIASIVLITRLHPSTKPPQIFREDTNLQMLLDLKSSMGVIDEISCSQCSAINDVHKHNKYKPTTNNGHLPNPKDDHQHVVPMATTLRPKHVNPMTTPRPMSYKPPEFDMRPSNQSVLAGRNMYFYCSVKGYPAPSLSWEKDGQRITRGEVKQRHIILKEEGILKLDGVQKTDQGIYTCIASNERGVIRASASLTVNGSSTAMIFPATKLPPPIAKTSVATPKSVPENFDMCKKADCTKTKDRPMLETGATVYVVFGISGLDQSGIEPGHVMQKDKGKVIFDPSFKMNFNFSSSYQKGISTLCNICKQVSSMPNLVRNGSAQCFPDYIAMQYILNRIPACHDLPKPVTVYGRQAQAHVVGGFQNNSLQWWAFAFESTTSKDQSYFEAYKEYLKWEELMKKIKQDYESTQFVQNVFQTSQFWPQVMMEVVAVNSAIYSLVFSMVICLVAVAIFTSHVTLLLIVFITILEMICLVAGIFYLAGWEMGGVEAISLSILVGSSVDYCVHLVEGFLLAGKAIPDNLKNDHAGSRQWRTKAAISHIGVSIFSSAMTTIIAAIPLTQTTILPFSKFGQILAINSSVSIVYCLTICAAFLAFMGPSKFVCKWKSTLKMTIGTCVVIGLSALGLFIISKCGIFIPGPNGGALFPE